MGKFNQVKNCQHLKPFGIADFYPPKEDYRICCVAGHLR